ncbi:hypothetical protein DID88_002908 [Monilinia fructigena]|uniref:HAD-superfamily subfamily IIA hydrolase n=1 Tax=Monilinia fructigena TaxID=38457 RepID=A0A395INF3_9HELO|nr:hypothetical protein DID88_002908 [Monilinia fructigena]
MAPTTGQRWSSTVTPVTTSILPGFAFAFDIDGVLLRSSSPIPGASEALNLLYSNNIPFILLTNGGGKHESARVTELILVTGGDGDKCRKVAEMYGFTKVVTPGDILMAYPTIWPFNQIFSDYYIVLDLLLSEKGILGTHSSKNGDTSLPNNGWQQDGQPKLYFSNPDLFWATNHHMPRLGQGGFQASLEGVWNATTGGAKLERTVIGKPHSATYKYAERVLNNYRTHMLGGNGEIKRKVPHLKRVFMVGDNPESDIRGANDFESSHGTDWTSVLVKTGVYQSGTVPAYKPKVIVRDVYEAVKWALDQEGWHSAHK